MVGVCSTVAKSFGKYFLKLISINNACLKILFRQALLMEEYFLKYLFKIQWLLY